ncbi:hypothetical protein DFH29DRAFT_926892 [Suillus ampliporus]|nr:hypothetical protein DFH29DRAFT_926892 [Suillus ampliporus]
MVGKLLVFLITLPAMSSCYPLTPDIDLRRVNPPSPTRKFIFRRRPACYSVLLKAQHFFATATITHHWCYAS